MFGVRASRRAVIVAATVAVLLVVLIAARHLIVRAVLETTISVATGYSVWIGSETLGTHHPDTLVCEANLAVSLRQEGHTQDAEELRARVLADFTRVLGASHPDLAQLHKWQRINRDLEPQQI